MHFHSVFGLLVAVAGVTTASPLSHAETSVTVDAALRLIKVSESDPGTWVREDEKIENYVAKGVKFVDITDMNVGNPSGERNPAMIRISLETDLAHPSGQEFEVASTLSRSYATEALAVTYPSTLSHQTEANALISKISASGQKTFLKTLTE